MYPLNTFKKNSNIISIENFFSDDEIGKIFKICEDEDFFTSEVYAKNRKKFLYNKDIEKNKLEEITSTVEKTLRDANLKWIKLNNKSEWLYNKLISSIKEVNVSNYNYILNFIEILQFSKYNSSNYSFHSKHIDCQNADNLKNFEDIRKLSFSIQLTNPEEYEGGNLKFYSGNKSIYTGKDEYSIANKKKGSITFFPSNIFHEVTPVTKGNRYSLVGWVSGPNIL